MARPSGTQGVNFIKKYYAGGGVRSPLENLPNSSLTFTNVLKLKQAD